MSRELQNVENILQLYTFKNELGENIVWTAGQKEIMAPIINLGIGGKQYVQVESPTQYGKSSAIAGGLIMRCTRQEKWVIVAGTAEKAQIIMDYLIDYALQNPIPVALLKNVIPIERLKQERSRRHLSFSSGFEVRVFSADSRNKQTAGNAIMGQGSPFVILDEASLVDDVIESKVFRMIAGFSTTKHLYLKVGNPFYRNHFLRSHNDPDFHLVHFDYHRGIEEGRFTQEIVEKARQKPGFNVLYEVKFPEPSAVDERGWSSLLTDEDVEACFIENGVGFGFLKVGCDPAGEGTNFNAVVLRYRNYARVLFKARILDQWRFAEKIVEFKDGLKRDEQMMPIGYFVDKVGVGEGYYQTLRLDLENVYGVNVGVKAQSTEDFVNMRAEAFWRLRQEIKSRKLQLERDDDWFQLARLKYRTKLEGKRGKIEIMGKEEMLSNGIQSPDVADALMLTFTTLDPLETVNTGDEDARSTQFDRHEVFGNL